MKQRAPRWLWPALATGLFLANVGVICLIVYIAVTQADPLGGPPAMVDEGGAE
ncbi:MAG: hypothetical protein Tsb0013_03230 [Phycisphaerales bacterium]